MIRSFLQYLKYEKRYSAHTITAYQTDLTQFTAYLEQEFSSTIDCANYLEIRAWIVAQMESNTEPTSINRKIATLRTYYKFLRMRETIGENPMDRIKPIKKNSRLPEFIQESEMLTLLDNCAFPDGFKGVRDRLVLELFYGTGIRLSELIALKESNIGETKAQIKVLGKRNKERIIPINTSLLELIRSYQILKKNTFGIQPHDKLIVNNQGNVTYPMFVYRLVKHYLNSIHVGKRSPHILRHTFATHLLNKGADLNAVKDLLGHSSLASTQVYTHNSIDKLKKVFALAHPKA